MNNQECKVTPENINANSNESVFYPFSIKTSKCSGSCNNNNDPYGKMCVLDVIKNLNVKLFNLMSKNNETWHIKWHETYKQRWNDDKCRCECKKLIKEYPIRDLFGILVIVSLNVINYVMLVNI